MPEMAATKTPALTTAAEIRTALTQAEAVLHQATEALAQAIYRHLSDPSIDTAAAQAAVAAAQKQVARFRAALPVAEAEEAAALAATQAALRADQCKRLDRKLKALVNAAMQFTAAQTNAASSWHRMTKAAGAARSLLPDALRSNGAGFNAQLAAVPLRHLCELEISRIGLRPVLDPNPDLTAPGARAAGVPINMQGQPERLPTLEAGLKSLAALIGQAHASHLLAPVRCQAPGS
jgi:hypothetical protein